MLVHSKRDGMSNKQHLKNSTMLIITNYIFLMTEKMTEKMTEPYTMCEKTEGGIFE